MKPSSWDHQLGLASLLNYAAIQSGHVASSSKRERGLDASHHAPGPREGRGDTFFLDILFHRVSVTEILRQLRLPKLAKGDGLRLLAEPEFYGYSVRSRNNKLRVGHCVLQNIVEPDDPIVTPREELDRRVPRLVAA